MITALYALTICGSAALLFVVQPMFARLVLPLLGGSPAVWNTAIVFFQAALLAGYAYAHAGATWLGVRRHAALHLVVLLLPLAVLPLAIPAGWTPPTGGNPAPWLLGLMTVAVGLPFFAVSATSPLLQRWFAATGHRQAADPYFLYAASNIGSMAALLAYPSLVEPHLRLAQQTRFWMWGYVLLVVLVVACAVALWRTRGELQPENKNPNSKTPTPKSIPVLQRLRWVFLAFVPSSLMLGVTSYLSSDVAVIPLMWIVPLALYLLTFILAFARREWIPRLLLVRVFPMFVIALVLLYNLQLVEPIGGLILLHLVTFFLAALLCHGRLAADRPEPERLTEFYLWLSVGGVLGGIFNALVAPVVFHSIVEYPLALVLACFGGLGIAASEPSLAIRSAGLSALRGVVAPVLFGGVTIALVLLVERTPYRTNPVVTGLLFGVPALVCFLFSRHPLRFALGVGALFIAGSFFQREKGSVLYAERSFFGVNRVMLDPTGEYHLLIHGVTLHGRQSLDPARRHEALTYYHWSGPAGQVLQSYAHAPEKRVAVVGLGAGSLATYAQAGQVWTYYEIDPAVERIARNEAFFTFLHDAAAPVRVVAGDARLSLAAELEGNFDVMVMDAFSSDAIPVHLVTREALALYLRKLAPGGVLAFHISNLHLDLEPVFANLARDASLAALIRDDTYVSPADYRNGKSPSIWLVMARAPADLTLLSGDSRWSLPHTNAEPVWTDDYSSLLRAFRWH